MTIRTLVGLAVIVIGTISLSAEPINPKWDKEISRLEMNASESSLPVGGIVFTGSSSIRRWDTLAKDFPDVALANRGFGGSQISGLIAYFDRVVVPGNPAQIIIYSGTNDLSSGESVEHVLSDFATLCGMIRVALPETKVVLISAAPNPKRWEQREIQRRFNRLAAAYCERMGYDFIDVWSPMLGEDGMPSRDIYVEDQLHMNAAGYVIWREIIGPHLKR